MKVSGGHPRAKTGASLLFGLVILLFVLLLPVHGRSANGLKEIQICTMEWAPYTSTMMKNYGIASEYIRAVFSDMGYVPQFIFMCTDTCEDRAAENDRNDGIRGAFAYIESEERKKKGLLFSDPLFFIEEVVFFNKRKHPELTANNKTSSLSAYEAAFVRGYSYSPKIENALRDRKNVENEIEAFRQLVDGEMDLVPSDLTVGMYILKHQFPDQLGAIGVLKEPRGKKISVHFMVSDRNPHNKEFLKDFNNSLQNIKSSRDFIYRIKMLQETKSQKKRLHIVSLMDPSNAFVIGQDKEDPGIGYILPKGTMAEVIKWPDAILKDHPWPPGPVSSMDHWATVRIINGPHRGRELRIQTRYIVLSKE